MLKFGTVCTFLEVTASGVLQKELLLKISQKSQENTYIEIFF